VDNSTRLTLLLALAVSVSVVALLYARWEYRERGRLTFVGLALLCVMLFVPNLALDYATDYRLPSTLAGYVGVVVGGLGLALCLVSIAFFRSPSKVLCLDTGTLTIAGPYRWSRNPQYVGWLLFLLGFALTDWSLWCLPALVVVAVSLHILVLIEEEHLRRVFGAPYIEYFSRVSRYVGRPS
jgi:protein-S-isoprenylcysteine O-methyltransferase Ste14